MNRGRRRRPRPALRPCRSGRCWRAACRRNRLAMAGRACERRHNCAVHPRIRWTYLPHYSAGYANWFRVSSPDSLSWKSS
jgi:hypothetical protein